MCCSMSELHFSNAMSFMYQFQLRFGFINFFLFCLLDFHAEMRFLYSTKGLHSLRYDGYVFLDVPSK